MRARHLLSSQTGFAGARRARTPGSRSARSALFHFSETGDIAEFRPRSVAIAALRPPGREWLNGPLVWAIDADHAPLYLFPRDCPRILMWRKVGTSEADVAAYWTEPAARIVAFVETGWLDRIARARLYRYYLPAQSFLSLGDAGMHVSCGAVTPMAVRTHDDLPGDLASEGVTLRPLPDLLPLRGAWGSSLHVSGIRLRNARGWPG